MVQDSPKMAQDSANIAQVEASVVRGIRTRRPPDSHLGAKVVQDSPKMARDSAKIAQREDTIVSAFAFRSQGGPRYQPLNAKRRGRARREGEEAEGERARPVVRMRVDPAASPLPTGRGRSGRFKHEPLCQATPVFRGIPAGIPLLRGANPAFRKSCSRLSAVLIFGQNGAGATWPGVRSQVVGGRGVGGGRAALGPVVFNNT